MVKSASKILSKSFVNITNLNKLLPSLLLVTFAFILIEILTYRGFTQKYFIIDASWLLVISISLLFLYFYQMVVIKKTVKPAISSSLFKIFSINYFLFFPVIAVYFIFFYLEKSHHPNYIFTNFHIQYENAELLFILMGTNLLGYFIKNKKTEIADLVKKFSFEQIIIIFSLILVTIPNTFRATTKFYENFISAYKRIGLSHEERMIQSLGGEGFLGWIVPYTNFIKERTPEDSVIFIPPQLGAWLATGNGGYMRYFLYPRKLINDTEIESPIPEEATHVLISHGLWRIDGGGGWPKITIPAERIEEIGYIDRASKETTIKKGVDYDNNPKLAEWGIITLRK
jgi:hypothetical protein